MMSVLLELILVGTCFSSLGSDPQVLCRYITPVATAVNVPISDALLQETFFSG